MISTLHRGHQVDLVYASIFVRKASGAPRGVDARGLLRYETPANAEDKTFAVIGTGQETAMAWSVVEKTNG
jgi:hypothetical protein